MEVTGPKVQVTLQLTVSQSVRLGVDPTDRRQV
jgi:hypothetical protein